MAEDHTLRHFRSFWRPTVLDRTRLTPEIKERSPGHCEELIREKTKRILETHSPRPLSEDLVKEIKKVEESWFKEAGLSYEYPRKSS